MKEEVLNDLKRRIQFNLTEPETLVELVNNATEKGDKIQKQYKRLRIHANESYKLLIAKGKKILFSDKDLYKEFDAKNWCSVGIDGSFFPIGGIGGQWFSPYSVARIVFYNGVYKAPSVDIYSAGIEEINEQDFPNYGFEASLRMLVGETKALENWGSKNIPSIVFIDGPIVDPPIYSERLYIDNRCQAIRNCLKNSIIIGCVKSSRDSFFLDTYDKILDKKKSLKLEFLSDQYLYSFLFSSFRSEHDYKGILFSEVIDISKFHPSSVYQEFGIKIFCVYFQNAIDTKILRLDVPINDDNNINDIIFKKAVKATSDWQYPKQDVPLPIKLAHEKCKIREGTAEVLYYEILTRSKSTNLTDQIMMHYLR